MNFKDKVVIITGASRGIGKAAAIAFAKQGAKLLLAYHQEHQQMDELITELQKLVPCIAVSGDIGRQQTIDNIVKSVKENFGYVDILINNAGAVNQFVQVTAEGFVKTMQTNLYSVISLTQAILPLLKLRDGANIINIASIYGIKGGAAVASYTAAKAGVINYTKSMALELAPYIRVNAIAPGNIDTDMTRAAGKDFVENIINNTPMKRLGTAEEIASAIVFLASNQASFITGHTLVIDGGYLLN